MEQINQRGDFVKRNTIKTLKSSTARGPVAGKSGKKREKEKRETI